MYNDKEIKALSLKLSILDRKYIMQKLQLKSMSQERKRLKRIIDDYKKRHNLKKICDK